MEFNPNKFSRESIELLQKPVKDNFLSVGDAAKILNKSTRMVRYLIESGILYGSIKFGKTWLVCKISLDDYIQNNKTGE